MKYLTFIRHPESYRDAIPPPALMEAMGRFVERSLQEGTLVDTGGLRPSKDGFRVRLSKGKLTVTDGPFSANAVVIQNAANTNATIILYFKGSSSPVAVLRGSKYRFTHQRFKRQRTTEPTAICPAVLSRSLAS